MGFLKEAEQGRKEWEYKIRPRRQRLRGLMHVDLRLAGQMLQQHRLLGLKGAQADGVDEVGYAGLGFGKLDTQLTPRCGAWLRARAAWLEARAATVRSKPGRRRGGAEGLGGRAACVLSEHAIMCKISCDCEHLGDFSLCLSISNLCSYD